MGKMVVEEMSKDVFRLCYYNKDFELQGNAYLLINSQGKQLEGVLIDPGSLPGFEALREVLEEKLAGGRLAYVILQHQDPDICACLPELEKQFPGFIIVTHWRAAVLIKHYGLFSSYHYINESRYILTLDSGKQLLFFHTPYAHSPASLMTYDPVSKILFTGDLFGAFSSYSDKQGIIGEEVDEEYFEAMKLFHENFIPSNDIISIVMQLVASIKTELGIKWLASQHGSPLPENMVQEAVNHLINLECGEYLYPIVREINEPEAVYQRIIEELINLQASIFGRKYWTDYLKEKGFLEEDGNIKENISNARGLEDLLGEVLEHGGYAILGSIKNRVLKLCHMYGLPIPDIFTDSEFRKGEKELADYEHLVDFMSNQLHNWQREASKLKDKLEEINTSVNRDKLTGLYNINYMMTFLQEAMGKVDSNDLLNFSIMAISIDDIHLINEAYGEKKGNRIITEMSIFLQEQISDNDVIFRFQGPTFFIFFMELSQDSAVEKGEYLRNTVLKERFDRISLKASVGIMYVDKFQEEVFRTAESIVEGALYKVRYAQKSGGNRVVKDISLTDISKKALIADYNHVSRRLIVNMLQEMGFECIEAEDGAQALEILKKEELSIILVEAMLPKYDGHYLLNYIKYYSNRQDIPVVFISIITDPQKVVQALDKGAVDYIYKPFDLPVVKSRLKKIISGEEK